MTQQISATHIDHMGSDLTVINAARVTMGVEHEELTERDEKLISFLSRERHVTPFRHAQVSFRCKAPIAIARQLGKHQVGFSWNEMSRRYKDGDVDCYIPDVIFRRPKDLHSGSGEPFPQDMNNDLKAGFNNIYCHAISVYNSLLKDGVAPEQARFILPQGMITEWVWTGSLYGWFELYRQRSSSHAQYEVRLFADEIDKEMTKLYPVAWNALKETIK